MIVLGLTGNLASGKTTILNLFKARGAVVFDIDRIVHRYFRDKKSKIYKEVVAKFPDALRGKAVSREKLRDLVFSDKKKLKTLERIVHPVVIGDLVEWIKKTKCRDKIYLAEVPLLFEKKLNKYFDKIILVNVNKGILIERIVNKYKVSQSNARSRLDLYIPIREKIKRSDFVIKNNLNLKEFKKEVDQLWKKVNQK